MFPTGGSPFSTEWFTIDGPAAMFAIGDSLREARTRRGLSAADVHKGIRIRERYLTALEEEHWELLPGEAYAKGFLRTYAEFLGLNGNLYIDEYNSRIAHHDAEPLLVPESLAVSHRTRRGVLRTLMVVFVLGAAVAGLAAWRMGGSAAQPAASAAKSKSKPAAAKPVVQALPTAAPAAAKPAAKPVAAPAPAARAKTTVISASRGRCWLAVRTGGPHGTILFQGVLEQGKTLRYPLKHDLWVRMGRPDNLDITLGNHRVNSLPVQSGNVLLTRSGPQAA
jgi:cytoskeleton protein RodZ